MMRADKGHPVLFPFSQCGDVVRHQSAECVTLRTGCVCCCCFWLMMADVALFSALLSRLTALLSRLTALLSRLTALVRGSTWVTSFRAPFWISTEVVYLQRWHETAAVSAQVLCTSYDHAPCHFMQSHVLKVCACLAVTCHLHFWQNDRDLLCATAVTQDTEIRVSTESWPWRRKSPAAPAGIRTRDLSITSPVL